MDLARLRLDSLPRGGVGVGVAELVVAADLDLRRRLLRSARGAGAVLRHLVGDGVELGVLVEGGVVLGVDLALVVVGLLLEQVPEHGLHVAGGALVRASLDGPGLLEFDEGLLELRSLDDGEGLVPPGVLRLVLVLGEVLHLF